MAVEDVDTLRATYSAVQRSDGEELPEHVAHDIEWNLPEAVPGVTDGVPSSLRSDFDTAPVLAALAGQ